MGIMIIVGFAGEKRTKIRYDTCLRCFWKLCCKNKKNVGLVWRRRAIWDKERKRKMLICLLLFSRRKRSPAASIFLLFSRLLFVIIVCVIYIYILYISFVPKRIGRTKWASFVYPVSVCEKHVLRVIPQVKIFLSCCRLVCRKDRFSSVSVYMCVCVCVYAAIKKSRHDVVASVKGTRYFSLLRYLSELQRSANVPKAFCNSSLEREASARSGTSASAVRDLTVHPISGSTPRKNRNRCSLTMYTTSTYITMLDYTQTVGLVDFSSTCFSRALPRRLRSNMAKKKMFFLIT